jgi:hypothetical protein
MTTVYLVTAAICFVFFYIGLTTAHRKTELHREPVLGLAIILGLLGPIMIVVGIAYLIYVSVRYKMNSRK